MAKHGIAGNRNAIGKFHLVMMHTLYKWLNRRSERRSYNWVGMNELLRHFDIALPRIVPRKVKMYA